jgi:hypothetical protein
MMKMNVRTSVRALLAIAAMMVLSGLSQAQMVIPATEAAGPPATSAPGDGLNGAWFFDPSDPTSQNFANLLTVQSLISAEQPYGTFTATTLAWNGSDSADINDFLNSFGQNDASTLKPAGKQPIYSSLFDLTGFINITAADQDCSFILGSDDGGAMYIGMPGTYDIKVTAQDGNHALQAGVTNVHFEAPGLYPIEVIYWNQDYQNHSGSGQFFLLCSRDGGTVSKSRLYTKVTP